MGNTKEHSLRLRLLGLVVLDLEAVGVRCVLDQEGEYDRQNASDGAGSHGDSSSVAG